MLVALCLFFTPYRRGVACGVGNAFHESFVWQPGTLTSESYLCVQAGFKDVVHLEGGLSQWRYDGLPMEYS